MPGQTHATLSFHNHSHAMAKDSRARWFTTKVPSQVDKGDIILFNSENGKGDPLESPVIEQPHKRQEDGKWLIKTERFPGGCLAEPSLRISIKRVDIPSA